MRTLRCGLIALVSLTLGADWPVHRGNERQTGATADELPAKLTKRWQADAGGEVLGTASVVGNVVYFGSLDGSVYAVDLKNGAAKWKAAAGTIKTAVGVHEGRVYAGNDDGVLHCLDAANGKSIWKFDAGAEVTSGIAFAGADVLFGCGDEHLHCVSRADGKERWKFCVAGGPVMGTPLVVGGRVVVSGCDSTLHAVDLNTGKELNKLELGGQAASSMASDGQVAYVTTMAGEAIAVDLKTLTAVWRFENRRKAALFASPALSEKALIVAARDGRVSCLDRATGRELWTFLADKRIDGSPVIAGKQIVFNSFDKNVYVLDLATGKEVQRLSIDAQSATPSVSQGCLFVGTDKSGLCCFAAP